MGAGHQAVKNVPNVRLSSLAPAAHFASVADLDGFGGGREVRGPSGKCAESAFISLAPSTHLALWLISGGLGR
jgi:hypothetical protein